MDMLKQILKDKFAGPALIILIIMYLIIACANFIAPYSKDFSDRNQAYAPPSPIYTIDENGKFSLPYTYNYIRVFEPKLYQNVYQLDTEQKALSTEIDAVKKVVDDNVEKSFKTFGG